MVYHKQTKSPIHAEPKHYLKEFKIVPMTLLFSLILSLSLGASGAWFMSSYAYRFGLLDIPNDRSSHNLPTPRGGGIGILAAFVVSSVWLALPLLVWLPAAFLALVSFFDDKLDLSPRTRLIFQFAAAFAVAGYALFISTGFPIQNSKVIIQNLPMLVLFCIIIVGTANFYNFMDGINGIAGITGAVGFGLLGLFAHVHLYAHSLVVSAFCLAAACLGFLPFNIPTAKVFMGDVGSVLLGFIFASYVVLLAGDAADLLLLAGFLSTFYADALTTLYVRKRDGERLSQAHRRHLYQLFANQKKVTHWKVSAAYGIIQLVVGLLLLSIRKFGLPAIVVTEFCLLCLWWLTMASVRKQTETAARNA